MKELIIASGKGGTGKTSIAAAFATLSENAIFADCDVDAADLHLVLAPESTTTKDFCAGHTARVREPDCIGCGACLRDCRFGAISMSDTGKITIDPTACEGCGVCVWRCPVEAIDFPEKICGRWSVSETRFGQMVHARLGIAEENSGKLVSLIRNQAAELAKTQERDLIIVDGSPGIGCPVIASITGADYVLIVTEPSVSGIHDMKRIAGLAKQLKVQMGVCTNKADVNLEKTQEIESFAEENNISVLGRIPFDADITAAQIAGKSVIEYSSSAASEEIRTIWKSVKQILDLS